MVKLHRIEPDSARLFNRFFKNTNFPRYISPDFLQYHSEGPEEGKLLNLINWKMLLCHVKKYEDTRQKERIGRNR